jgi:ATP-binding cassette, subfamily F, member 3
MEKLTAEKARLDAKLNDPKLYEGPASELLKVQKSLGELQRKLADAEERWLTAQEALEQVQVDA